MKAVLEQHFASLGFDVWFYRDHGSSVQVASLDEHGFWQWGEPLDRGAARPDPSLSLEREMLEQLVAAGSALAPPDRAQGRHLDDAVAVRDRLLALVELTWRAT